MKKRSGCIWIAAGVVIALLAGLLAYVTIKNATQAKQVTPEAPTVDVVVSTRALGIRDQIQTTDVELRKAPADIVPNSAARSLEQVVGLLTMVPLAPDEMILTTNVVSPTMKGEHVAFLMDKTKVAMAFPAGDLMTRIDMLKPGDHVDLLFSLDVAAGGDGRGGPVTFNALQNLEVAAVVHSQDLGAEASSQAAGKVVAPLAIIFALDPQDALVLKHLKDIGGGVDIVLRAPEATEITETQTVNINYIIDRYRVRIPVEP
jgi:pilus assembly protein CpaB